MRDRFNREIEYMRISLTDRCNLRCRYCMPCDVPFVPHEQIVTYEEITAICRCALRLGIDRFKITGGEPLLRRGSLDFLRNLKKLPGCRQVTVTTNGVLLRKCADELKEAGIDGVNVSLDTLDREEFKELTGKDLLAEVLDGLYYSCGIGLKMKVNCVPLEGFHEEEYLRMLDICRDHPIDVRFIELMPIGYGRDYAGASLEALEREIRLRFPKGEDVVRRLGNGPARYYHPEGFQGNIGFIDALHKKFCGSCNRVRLTSEGFLKTCLYYDCGVSLRDPLRGGCSMEELTELMERTIRDKPGEHHFNDGAALQDADPRKMSQIGG